MAAAWLNILENLHCIYCYWIFQHVNFCRRHTGWNCNYLMFRKIWSIAKCCRVTLSITISIYSKSWHFTAGNIRNCPERFTFYHSMIITNNLVEVAVELQVAVALRSPYGTVLKLVTKQIASFKLNSFETFMKCFSFEYYPLSRSIRMHTDTRGIWIQFQTDCSLDDNFCE